MSSQEAEQEGTWHSETQILKTHPPLKPEAVWFIAQDEFAMSLSVN